MIRRLFGSTYPSCLSLSLNLSQSVGYLFLVNFCPTQTYLWKLFVITQQQRRRRVQRTDWTELDGPFDHHSVSFIDLRVAFCLYNYSPFFADCVALVTLHEWSGIFEYKFSLFRPHIVSVLSFGTLPSNCDNMTLSSSTLCPISINIQFGCFLLLDNLVSCSTSCSGSILWHYPRKVNQQSDFKFLCWCCVLKGQST